MYAAVIAGDSSALSISRTMPICECASINPGSTVVPVQSTCRADPYDDPAPGPAAATRSPSTTTSPTNGSPSVPSTTRPSRKTICVIASPQPVVGDEAPDPRGELVRQLQVDHVPARSLLQLEPVVHGDGLGQLAT